MKATVRKQIIKKRKAISPALKQRLDALIRKSLFSKNAFKKAHTILIYVSKDDEVDTHAIIKRILKSRKRLAVPKMHASKIALHIAHLEDFAHLRPGKFGILEPQHNHKRIKPEEVDLWIVPGVAFDKIGHRIGYGKGYFDRLLQKIEPKKVLALAYDFQRVAKIKTHSYDRPVGLLITEKKTYVFPTTVR